MTDAIEGARRMLAAEREKVRKEFAATKVGQHMLWWTVRQLKSKNDSKRVHAVEKLAVRKDVGKVIPHLVSSLADDPNSNVRAAAATAFGRIADSGSVEPLFKALDDSHKDVREAAVISLGKIGDASIVPILISLLKDQDAKIRNASIKALVYVGLINSEARRLAADSLSSIEWKPEGNTQRAFLAVAVGKWIEAVSAGEAALQPLCSVLIGPPNVDYDKLNFSSVPAWLASEWLSEEINPNAIRTPDTRKAIVQAIGHILLRNKSSSSASIIGRSVLLAVSKSDTNADVREQAAEYFRLYEEHK